jgi:hypothetical protein
VDASLARGGGELWAITTYFNAIGWRSRLANYRMFRRHLKVPLITVELAYGPDFELHAGDAEILIQLRGRDVMWQKERLLNIALKALPDSCDKVAWLDCDIIFTRDDWPQAATRLLDRFVLVQLFSLVNRMPRAWAPGQEATPAMQTRRSIPFVIASGMPIDACLRAGPTEIESAHGVAWAARRELLETHGFYDGCIIGGGDTVMLRAAYGYFDVVIRKLQLTAPEQRRYLAWGVPFHDAVRAQVGFVDGDVLHLWHGEPRHRKYGIRNRQLQYFQFDPFTDIVVGENGCWRWASDKPQLHDYVRDYFVGRREDD